MDIAHLDTERALASTHAKQWDPQRTARTGEQALDHSAVDNIDAQPAPARQHVSHATEDSGRTGAEPLNTTGYAHISAQPALASKHVTTQQWVQQCAGRTGEPAHQPHKRRR